MVYTSGGGYGGCGSTTSVMAVVVVTELAPVCDGVGDSVLAAR